MDPQKLSRRTERFLIFRLAVIPVAFVLVAICRSVLTPARREPALFMLYGLLGFYTLLAVAALAVAPRIRRRRAFAVSQVAIDFVVAAVLIWSTGGLWSIFTPLLFATLFNACTVLHGGGALAFASLSTAYLALTGLGYQFWDTHTLSPWPKPPPGLDQAGAASHLVAVGLALHVVALLGTRLSRRLLNVQSVQEEIIENMAEGLVAIDENRRIIELNGEARRIFGLSRERPCVGRPLGEVFSGTGLNQVREAFVGGERRRFEFALERSEGETLPVEGKVTRVEDEGGRVRCRIGLFGDLSLKREVEKAEARIQKLEQLYDMAMGIAHEIRNPLASIQGCAQEISRGSSRTPQEEKLVQIICRESSRLDRIIEDFMTNARRGPTDLKPVDLVGVLEETVIQLRNHPQVGARRFHIDPPSAAAWISGDAQRLKQVFLNLGTNAIEATDPQQGEIRVAFRDREFLAMNRRRAGERRLVPGIEVEFSDNGTGIPREAENLVFTPFFTTKERGHGLGLAVVHRIVHDHLGAVAVESEPGKGTSFRVWFPRLATGSGPPAPAALAAEVIHA